MLTTNFITFFVTSLAAGSSAVTLALWTGNGCTGLAMRCNNILQDQCCSGGRPFNVALSGDFTHAGRDLYGYSNNGCRGTGAVSVRCGAGLCCTALPRTNSIAGNWYQGTGPPLKRGLTALEARDDTDSSVNCTKPDQAEFYDHAGVHRVIHIPEGTFETALELFEKEDWASLTEFPAWSE